MKKFVILFYIFFSLIAFCKCSIIQIFTNFSHLQFKLGEVNGFTVNNIDISTKSSLTDLTPIEIFSLSSTISQGKLPISFVLNVDIKNTDDRTGGYAKADVTLKSFMWRLFIDDLETISGDIEHPVTVPANGEIESIPLKINLDLLQYFNNQGFDNLINLILSIGGKQGSASKITLYATPVVSTCWGDIKYTGELKIIEKQFTN